MKKGTIVKIKNSDNVYENYTDIFEKLGFKNTKINEYKDVFSTLFFEVVTNTKHPFIGKELYFIKSNDVELLVEEIGIVEVEKTYELSETFVKELCKEPNIKEAFIREGIIDETIEIKKSLILNTPNDLELGQLIRKML